MPPASDAGVRDWQQSPKPGAAFKAAVDIKTPGINVIEVRDGYNNARSPEPYELITTLSGP